MSSSYRQGLFWRVLVFVSEQVDHRKHWDKLPLAPALAVLVGIRTKLRQQNLYDTGRAAVDGRAERAAVRREHRTQRTSDGSYNDLAVPTMGMAGTRFGRNVPLETILPATDADVLATPSPREVSRRLMTRHEFIAGRRRELDRRGLAAVHDPRLVQPR